MRSNGSVSPISGCDIVCADANRCMIGGMFCVGCERWFCADDMGNGDYCAACLEEISAREDMDEGEDD